MMKESIGLKDKAWTSYTSRARRKLPKSVQARLLAKHLHDWIGYWCKKGGSDPSGFQKQLRHLMQLVKEARG